MRNRFIPALLLAPLLTGCLTELEEASTPTICPPVYQVTRDSVLTGSYLGIAINDEATNVYGTIQSLRQSRGVTYLNVVSNIYSDLSQLRNRLPLYEYILLDQRKGTDSGVQITLEGQRVKSIFLNSGRSLRQWPEKLKASASVQIGDEAETLYNKLALIRDMAEYAPTFEYIFPMTKNLETPYDQGMSQSPQWYFTYPTGPGQMDEVQVYLRNGRVSRILINHYRP